jgi:uncharacterized protein
MSALCAGWKMFYDHSAEGFKRLAAEVRRARGLDAPAPGRGGNIVTARKVPERNAPCPCGSGKKFKNCCLKK